jgi:hypothetical protein
MRKLNTKNPLGLHITSAEEIRKEFLGILESKHTTCKRDRIYVYEIAEEYNKNRSGHERLSNTAIGFHLNAMGLIWTISTYGSHPKGPGLRGRIVTNEMIDKLKQIYH